MINFGIILISFRDFIEAFLLISILFVFSKKENLNKEKAIIVGGLAGLVISLIVLILAYNLIPSLKFLTNRELIEKLSSFSAIISGSLLLYITYKIHPLFIKHKDKRLNYFLGNSDVTQISFATVCFMLVLGEGFEIFLFTSSTSFFESPIINIYSLLAGFIFALATGVLVYRTFLKNHIKSLFRLTELLLVIYGFYLIFHGLIEAI